MNDSKAWAELGLTPIENRKLQGQITKTIIKGEIAFERT